METKYLIIVLILSIIIAGLLVAIIIQGCHLRALTKQLSQSHYEKIKLQLMLERMQKQKTNKIRKITYKSNE